MNRIFSPERFAGTRKVLAMLALGLVLSAQAALTGCNQHAQDPGDFTAEELELIASADSIMRVLTIADRSDSLILRDTSRTFSAKALMSEDYEKLCSLMVATVTHPSQDGVGIAGPQVGLNRRVVAVQRFDKAGEPFEVYPNIRIISASDSLAYGPEGCLSVPDRREEVARSTEVIIEYADIAALKEAAGPNATIQMADCDIPMVRDTIRGFTAVIFQHETDHLDGILYIDRL